MSDHRKGCKLTGCYSPTTCPECGAKITPHRPHNARRSAPALEARLRERPVSGCDVDGNLMCLPDGAE